MSVFVIRVEAIIYLLLYILHDCTFNNLINEVLLNEVLINEVLMLCKKA